MNDTVTTTGFSHAWRALRHRNFRLYFLGQGVSVLGTWMTRFAAGWLVYRLTHSALLLGVTSFAGQIVSFIIGPVAGAWIDRLERRRLLIWTQAAAAVQSLALAALTISGTITLGQVIALMVMQGVINAFDMPARQSLLPSLVGDRNDMGNAIALNSAMVNGGRLLGPPIAGLLIVKFGEGWCFLVDGVSYLAVIASLMAMRLSLAAPRRSGTSLFREIVEGWDYVRGHRAVRAILILFSWTALLGWSYGVLLPVFADQVLHGGPRMLAWLSAASGAGALLSAVTLALRKTAEGLPDMMRNSVITLGLSLIVFGLSRSPALSVAMMIPAGFGLMQTASAANTVVQSLISDDKRARVMGYYTMAFFGAAPLGSLLIGILAHRIGSPASVVITGSCCLLGAIWFGFELPQVRAAMRPAPVAAE